jgi:hypothetical protein
MDTCQVRKDFYFQENQFIFIFISLKKKQSRQTQNAILQRPLFFDSLVTLSKHFSVNQPTNQPTGLENHSFTFINVFKLFIFLIFERLPQQQERDAVAGYARYCMRTVWLYILYSMAMDEYG